MTQQDDITQRLNEIHADAGYLFGRVAADGACAGAMAESVRARIDAIKALLSKLRAPVADERQPDGKRPDLDWIEGVRVTDTIGRGWCVRIDGTDIFEDVNRYGCKGRKSFQIASGLTSKQEAERAALEWLDRQRAALASAPVAKPKSALVDDGICWSSKEIQRRQKEEDEARAAYYNSRASAPVADDTERGLTFKQAWWAGYRAGKDVPPDTPRQDAVNAAFRCRKCGEQAKVRISSAHLVTHRPDGMPRDERDIASDPEGKLMLDPGAPLLAASAPVAGEAQRPWGEIREDTNGDLAIFTPNYNAKLASFSPGAAGQFVAGDFLYAAPQASAEYERGHADGWAAAWDQAIRQPQADKDGGQQRAGDVDVGRLLTAAKGMTKLYGNVWDRADGALVVFPENVARFDAAFDALRAAVGEVVDDATQPEQGERDEH